MPAGDPSDHQDARAIRVQARLLGPFSVALAEREVGSWPRPSAKRVCELVFVSRGLRVGRGVACEVLFGRLGPTEASNALSKALSLARALSPLGPEASGLL